MTAAQAAEKRRLVKEEGLTEEQATTLVTMPQLDVPLDADGQPAVPLPSSEPVTLLPHSLLPEPSPLR